MTLRRSLAGALASIAATSIAFAQAPPEARSFDRAAYMSGAAAKGFAAEEERFLAAAAVLATVPGLLAHSTLQGLASAPPPVSCPTMPMYLIWHARYQQDAAHQWLRAQLQAATGHADRSGSDAYNMALSLRRATILDGGTSTTDDFVASLAANVGSQVDLARRLGENQTILKETLENRRDAVSGVNLDEEVGALIQQQQAYAAAARIITTIQENIRTLLELIN